MTERVLLCISNDDQRLLSTCLGRARTATTTVMEAVACSHERKEERRAPFALNLHHHRHHSRNRHGLHRCALCFEVLCTCSIYTRSRLLFLHAFALLADETFRNTVLLILSAVPRAAPQTSFRHTGAVDHVRRGLLCLRTCFAGARLVLLTCQASLRFAASRSSNVVVVIHVNIASLAASYVGSRPMVRRMFV